MCARIIVPLLEECSKVYLTSLTLRKVEQKEAACALSSPSEKKRKAIPFIHAGLVLSRPEN